MARPAFLAAFTLPFAIAALPLIAVFYDGMNTRDDDTIAYVPSPVSQDDTVTHRAQNTEVTIGYDEFGCENDHAES